MEKSSASTSTTSTKPADVKKPSASEKKVSELLPKSIGRRISAVGGLAANAKNSTQMTRNFVGYVALGLVFHELDNLVKTKPGAFRQMEYCKRLIETYTRVQGSNPSEKIRRGLAAFWKKYADYNIREFFEDKTDDAVKLDEVVELIRSNPEFGYESFKLLAKFLINQELKPVALADHVKDRKFFLRGMNDAILETRIQQKGFATKDIVEYILRWELTRRSARLVAKTLCERGIKRCFKAFVVEKEGKTFLVIPPNKGFMKMFLAELPADKITQIQHLIPETPEEQVGKTVGNGERRSDRFNRQYSNKSNRSNTGRGNRSNGLTPTNRGGQTEQPEQEIETTGIITAEHIAGLREQFGADKVSAL